MDPVARYNRLKEYYQALTKTSKNLIMVGFAAEHPVIVALETSINELSVEVREAYLLTTRNTKEGESKTQ